MGSAAIKPQRQRRLEIKLNGATECSDQLNCKTNIDDENKNTNKVSTQNEGLFRKNDTPGCFGITFRKRVSLSRKSKPSNVKDTDVVSDTNVYEENDITVPTRKFCDYGYLDHRTGIFFPPINTTDEYLFPKKHKKVSILPGNLKRSNVTQLVLENNVKLPLLEPSPGSRGSLVSLPLESLDNSGGCHLPPTRPKSTPYFTKQLVDPEGCVIENNLVCKIDKTYQTNSSSRERVYSNSKLDDSIIKQSTTDSLCDSNNCDPIVKSNLNDDDSLRVLSPECDNLDLVESVEFNINPSTRTAESSDEESCTPGPIVCKEHKIVSDLEKNKVALCDRSYEKCTVSEQNISKEKDKIPKLNTNLSKTETLYPESSSSDSQQLNSGFQLAESRNPLESCRPPARLAPLSLPDKLLSKVRKLRRPKQSPPSLSATELSETDASKLKLTTDSPKLEQDQLEKGGGSFNDHSDSRVKSSQINVQPCRNTIISNQEKEEQPHVVSEAKEDVSDKEHYISSGEEQNGDSEAPGGPCKHIRIMSARVPGNRRLVGDVGNAGDQGEFAHTERRVMSAGCRRKSGEPPEPLRPLTRIEIKKQTFEEGLRPEFRDGGVSFFIPVSEDGLRPHCSAEVVQDRITKSRKSQLRYEEKMMMAQINRQVQLSKRKQFAVREVQKIKSLRERGSSDSSRAESRAEGADSRAGSRTDSRLDVNRSDSQTKRAHNESDLEKEPKEEKYLDV